MEPPPLDTAWVEATRKKALLKLEKLDTDLKNYKGNSIKESIRCARGRGAGSIPARAGGGLHGGSLSCAQGWGAANQAHGLTHVHSWLGPQAGP